MTGPLPAGTSGGWLDVIGGAVVLAGLVGGCDLLGVGRGADDVAEDDGSADADLVVDSSGLPVPVPLTTDAPHPASAREISTAAMTGRRRGYIDVMTETPEPDEDDLRRHAEDPAEGPDPEQTSERDIAREHQEEPSEG